jgi:hypothetical protein
MYIFILGKHKKIENNNLTTFQLNKFLYLKWKAIVGLQEIVFFLKIIW